jgi:hypothetical protein
MGDMADFVLDLEDPFEHELYLDEEDTQIGFSCKYCGVCGLEWGTDKTGKWRLYSQSLKSGRFRVHKCKAYEKNKSQDKDAMLWKMRQTP